ncbi:MAG: SDR family NAD(P)-dependent oxidoreductase [bacterium]
MLDRALDWTVVPGYGSPGYRLRRRAWGPRVASEALADRDVLVTGASSGIGEAAARQLAEAGARVHLLARNPDRGEAARARLLAAVPGGGDDGERVRLHLCDVSDLDSVRAFAAAFAERVPRLAGLIHNAGVLTKRRERTPQGHERTLATAVIGPFLMTRMLLESLRAGAPSRVVWVSSGGMYTARLDAGDLELDHRDFDGSGFYAHAKRAQVILAELFDEREGDGVRFHSMHPGWADTPGVEDSLPRFHRVMSPILRDADQGADTAVWLLAAPEAAERGFWHDRRRRPTHRVPRTCESSADRERLWSFLEDATRAYTPGSRGA